MSKISVTKEFTWDCAHMLDGHGGLCSNLHGHTYKMEVTAETVGSNLTINEGPSRGMVLDFKDLKTVVNYVIIDHFDHALVINRSSQDPFEQELNQLTETYSKKVVRLPFRPTAENMAADFLNKLNAYLEHNKLDYKITKIRLYETPTSYAEVTV